MRKINAGIFGATGEVGQEIINVLHRLEFPINNLFLYEGKSAGNRLTTPFGSILVEKAEDADYSNLDLALWAISGDWTYSNRMGIVERCLYRSSK